jgi:hypothetical protein
LHGFDAGFKSAKGPVVEFENEKSATSVMLTPLSVYVIERSRLRIARFGFILAVDDVVAVCG